MCLHVVQPTPRKKPAIVPLAIMSFKYAAFMLCLRCKHRNEIKYTILISVGGMHSHVANTCSSKKELFLLCKCPPSEECPARMLCARERTIMLTTAEAS